MKLNSSKLIHKDIREDSSFFKLLLNNLPASVILLNSDNQILYCINSTDQKPFFNSIEVVGMEWIDLIHPEDKLYVKKTLEFLKENKKNTIISEFRMRYKEEENWRWVEVTAKNLLHEKSFEAIILSYKDITKKKDIHEKMHDYAYHDHTTGLTNRSLFHDRLKYAISNAHRNNHLVGVLFLELEFRSTDKIIVPINDKLQKIVARKIVFCLRETDTISRYSKDVFAVIIPDLKKHEDIAIVIQKIMNELEQPISIGERDIKGKVSIGVSIYPFDSTDAEQLISYADMTMYISKRQSVNTFRFYNSEIDLLYKDQIRG